METKEAIEAVIKEDGIDAALEWIAGVVDEKHSRIEALEKALRPFAELGEAWLPVDGGDNSIFVTCPDSTPVNNITNFGFTFGSFRNAARVALGEKKDE